MGFYLAVDTSTEACSVAVSIDGQARELFEPMQREHTQRVLPMIEALLTEVGKTLAQLDGIVCGIGPGSFAGLRVGVGVVKGIALARDLPVVGVSSLAMLSQRAMRRDNAPPPLAHGAAQVAAVIDARMSEVYVGAYRRSPSGLAAAVVADRVCAAATAPTLPEGPWLGVGTGWGRYEAELRRALAAEFSSVDSAALPHAEEALVLGLPEFAAGRAISGDVLAPAYLRDRVALTLGEQEALRKRRPAALK